MSTVALSRPVAGPSRLLEVDAAQFQADFGRRPFRIAHNLCAHALFTLPRLVELARALPEHRVEYNAGSLSISVDPRQTPRTGLSVEETIRRIEHCGSWLVLKNVELEPAYSALLDACLEEILQQGHPGCRAVGLREAFIFISSPGAVTPYHMDPELNFLLQIRGSKQMHVFPGADRSILTEQELERFYSGAHRNLVFRDEFQASATTFELTPGEGVHVPVTDPHWVKVGDLGYSISLSITFQTRATERRATLYTCNHWLRQRGLTPAPVGLSWWRDFVKYNTWRVARRIRNWLGAKP